MAKLSELSKGDVFLFDQKFGEMHRLHSISPQKNGRYLIHLIGLSYAGDISNAAANSFTWRDSDIQVYIPKFYLCEFKKSKWQPCIPVSNCRHLLPNNLNQINMSDKYCSHNKCWYDYAEVQ